MSVLTRHEGKEACSTESEERADGRRTGAGSPCSRAATGGQDISTPPKVMIAHIIQAASEVMDLELEALTGTRRAKFVVEVRHLATAIAYEFTDETLAEIGRRIGDRDHSTVLRAVRSARRRESERRIVARARQIASAQASESSAASALGRETEKVVEPKPTLAHIIRAACEVTGVDKESMTGPSRTRERADARQLAMAVAHEMTGRSLPEIGRRFGGRDHSTVLWAIRRIAERELDRADVADAKRRIMARAREIACKPPGERAADVVVTAPVKSETPATAESSDEPKEIVLSGCQAKEFERLARRGFTPKGLAKRYEIPIDDARVAYERALAG